MNTVKKRVATQFDLTKITLNNLSQYDITPTAKLVLLLLTDCYNPKHADVFPKQKTIAEKLGISDRSVVRAIQELVTAGLILIECKNTNRYILTDKLSILDRQNDTFTPDNLSLPCIRTKKETKKEQRVKFLLGGNVYSEDEQILRDYAKKHGARNIDAYVASLKKTKSAENIINEKQKIVRRAVATLLETKKQIEIYEGFRGTGAAPENCTAWVELGKKLGIKK